MKTKNYKPGQFVNIGGYLCRIKKKRPGCNCCPFCEEQNGRQCISAYPKSGNPGDCSRKLNDSRLYPKILSNGRKIKKDN